jgi:hypothetical protein
LTNFIFAFRRQFIDGFRLSDYRFVAIDPGMLAARRIGELVPPISFL